ncbi:MAG TPA: hypothetical protein GX502_00475 [Syntrophaceticus sp.]|nr:hypothetical protein [Syntrophaceticus sp.]
MSWESILSIMALSITIAGWFFTYKLNLDAQNKSFLNQITNDARIAITKSLIEYQKWLGEVQANIITTDMISKVQTPVFAVNWQEKFRESIKLFFQHSRSHDWVIILEEYEILFPETRDIRISLLMRQKELTKVFDEYLNGLIAPKEQRIEIIKKTMKKMPLLSDQISLIEDLKIYLQNKTLSDLTGNKIPEREPKDPSLPKIVSHNGKLTITG